MKLSNLTAKLTCVKRNAVRILSVAALAGATLAVAAPAAQAQQFGVAVHVGGPYRAPVRFYGPAYPVVPVGFWAEGRYWRDRRDYDDFCHHRDWVRYHHGWR